MIRQNVNSRQFSEMLIRSHESEAEYLGRCCENVISGIAMREIH